MHVWLCAPWCICACVYAHGVTLHGNTHTCINTYIWKANLRVFFIRFQNKHLEIRKHLHCVCVKSWVHMLANMNLARCSLLPLAEYAKDVVTTWCMLVPVAVHCPLLYGGSSWLAHRMFTGSRYDGWPAMIGWPVMCGTSRILMVFRWYDAALQGYGWPAMIGWPGLLWHFNYNDIMVSSLIWCGTIPYLIIIWLFLFGAGWFYLDASAHCPLPDHWLWLNLFGCFSPLPEHWFWLILFGSFSPLPDHWFWLISFWVRFNP